jgi:hypothetical protein
MKSQKPKKLWDIANTVLTGKFIWNVPKMWTHSRLVVARVEGEGAVTANGYGFLLRWWICSEIRW